MKNAVAAAEGRTKVHNVQFYKIAARAIETMTFSQELEKLALARSDGCIEIWDMQFAPTLQKTIANVADSVRALQWSNTRLFSAGASAELIEWNLQMLQPSHKQLVTGSACLCMCANSAGTALAVGTQQGFVNIFSIENDTLMYSNMLEKQQKPIQCLSFDRTGEFVVTAATNTLRICNVRTGHVVHRMKVAHADKYKKIQIWCLQVLSDFTIVAGDSQGYLSIWDGHKAALVDTIQALKAAVHSIAVDEQEQRLMCSGAEPIIRIYAKTAIKRDEMLFHRFIKMLQRNLHTHKVNTLLCANELIYSGGVDGYLGVSSLNKANDNLLKYPALLQQPVMSVAPEKELLLLRYTNYLEVWRLGKANEKKPTNTTRNSIGLRLEHNPLKLLQLQSKNNEHIVCAALSPDCNWLCYATDSGSRLFSFIASNVVGSTKAQLSRIKDVPEQFVEATHMQFSADSKHLFLYSQQLQQIMVFALLPAADYHLNFIESISTAKYFKDSLQLFCVSADSRYLVTASADRVIAVWRLNDDDGQYNYLLKLPRYVAVPTAIALHLEMPKLVAAYSDGKIIEYDLEEMCFSCASCEQFVDTQREHCISNICLDARNANMFVLQNDKSLFVLEKLNSKAALLHENPKEKRRKNSNETELCKLRLKFKNDYEHLISIAWLNRNELILLHVSAETLVEKLPKAYQAKLFGVS